MRLSSQLVAITGLALRCLLTSICNAPMAVEDEVFDSSDGAILGFLARRNIIFSDVDWLMDPK